MNKKEAEVLHASGRSACFKGNLPKAGIGRAANRLLEETLRLGVGHKPA